MTKQEQFIARIASDAQEVQRIYGVPASIVIAQAALETGWGERVLGNNVFGIKAGRSWQGATIDIRTHEYVGGERVAMTDKFRAFDSLKECIDNYAKLLCRNTRYADVLQAGNAYEAADALQRATYATDPNYATKLKSIISSNGLTRLDHARYRGYTEGTQFEETHRRLEGQYKNNPDVWDNFIKGFLQAAASIFSGLYTLVFGGEDASVAAPAPTPPRVVEAGGKRDVPPRG